MQTPPRPMLAPGLRVVIRGRDRLQVGIAPHRSAVVPRTPIHAAVLDALLEGSRPPDDDASRAVVTELVAQGVVVYAGARPARPRRATVAVLGNHPDPAALLGDAGIDAVGGDHAADAGLAVILGELDRDLLDPWVRSGLAHVVVRLVDDTAVLGPLVVPGSTACLRCLDEHRADEDPDHLAVLQRYATASGAPRRDGVEDPVDPMLVHLASAWAVRDLRLHLDGHRPSTWSTTMTFTRAPAGLTAATWLRHPSCWCSWM